MPGERQDGRSRRSRLAPVHVNAALLANVANVGPDGLLYVEGGGWENYSVLTLPATLDGHFAGIIALDDSEIGRPHVVGFSVSQAGQLLGSTGSMIVNSQRALVPFALRFTTVVHAVRLFVVELTDHDGGVLVAADCEVVLATPQ